MSNGTAKNSLEDWRWTFNEMHMSLEEVDFLSSNSIDLRCLSIISLKKWEKKREEVMWTAVIASLTWHHVLVDSSPATPTPAPENKCHKNILVGFKLICYAIRFGVLKMTCSKSRIYFILVSLSSVKLVQMDQELIYMCIASTCSYYLDVNLFNLGHVCFCFFDGNSGLLLKFKHHASAIVWY